MEFDPDQELFVLEGNGATGEHTERGPLLVDSWATNHLRRTGVKADDALLDQLHTWVAWLATQS